ncbi:hypothetical protein KAT80_00600 [Candidatus Pacearchaeota archaeon]|nr:hypothetical protein [Candidatus Pacearchaeota archaeon]
MDKFLENLEEAHKIISIADHMLYVTFPLIQDKKLLLKILLDTKIAISKCISSVLQYEYLYKRIKLCNDPKTNFRTFTEKCAKRYNITEQEIRLIAELFDVVEEHKKSSMEFMKNEKIVILSQNLQQKIVTIEKVKEFLILAKNILEKIKKTV